MPQEVSHIPPKLTRRSHIGPWVVIGLIVVMTVAIVALVGYASFRGVTQEVEEYDLRRISATGVVLDTYCREGYYVVPGEKLCSRAPKCGATPYDSYKYVADTVPSPDYGECTSIDKGPVVGDPPNANAFNGYVPLCCYEMARTHDPQRCVTDWERRWCHPDQCAQINNDSGCEEGGCQCGQELLAACDAIVCDLKSPVSLSDRLHVSGSTQSTETTTDTFTPTPSLLIARITTSTPTRGIERDGPTPDVLVDTPTATAPVEAPQPTVTVTPATDPAVTSGPTTGATRPTPTPLASTPTPSSATSRATPTYTPPPAQDTVGPSKPAPSPGPKCDSTCGVCGWRDAQGACQNSTPQGNATQLCCYRTCIDHSCVPVHGYGTNSCSSDAQCVTQTAYTATSTPMPGDLTDSGQNSSPSTTLPTAGTVPWITVIMVPVALILAALVL